MHRIKHAWLTTNYSCNLRCKWCYALNATDFRQEMPLEMAKSIVNTLAENDVKQITLIGGEPTLYSCITELISYIKGKDPEIRVSITTNGIRLSDESFSRKLIQVGLDGCNISLKGFSEEDYENNTGCRSGYKRALEGYQNFGKSGKKPVLSYVIADNDISIVDRLYEFCAKHSIERLFVQFVKPMIGPESSPVMSMRDMGKITEYINNSWGDDFDYKVEISFPICLIDASIYDEMKQKGKVVTGCHVQTGAGINFDINGRVLPCNHFVGMPFSNDKVLSSQDIERLRYSSLYQMVKDKARSLPVSQCKECIYWNDCRGGCFTRWLYEDPKSIISF